MSYFGPTFGRAAPRIVEALETLAETDPARFQEAETVLITVNGVEHEIPVEEIGFGTEQVTESGEPVVPAVIEPSFGVDRVLYTLLSQSFRIEERDGRQRTYLKLPPRIAPVLAGVFPLRTGDVMEQRALRLAMELREAGMAVEYDDSGSIGRRYRRQDEMGTPFCVTVDFETNENDTVTLRNRDSTDQIRVPERKLTDILGELRVAAVAFDDLRGQWV